MFDIEDFFSVLTYTLILFMFLVLLSLPNCRGGRTLQGLSSGADSIDRLNSEQLLLEMLRTPLPDNLPDVIIKQNDKRITVKFTLHTGLAEAAPVSFETEESFEIYKGLEMNDAVNLLNGRQDLYKGKTYAEFIDVLQFTEQDAKRKSNVFGVVTRAVFVSAMFPPHRIDLQPQLKEILTYPEVYVKYHIAGKFEKTDADLANPPVEKKPVKVNTVGTTIKVAESAVGESFAVIPITDQSVSPKTATVMLKIARGQY